MVEMEKDNAKEYEEKEKRIREIFSEEDCYTHVAMHYVIKQKAHGSSLKFNKDGTLNRRDNISRIVAKFAETLEIEIKREETG